MTNPTNISTSNPTSKIRRSVRGLAAAAAVLALGLGAAACGSETGVDQGSEPAAPTSKTPAATPASPHAPVSADKAERDGAAQADQKWTYSPGLGRPVPVS